MKKPSNPRQFVRIPHTLFAAGGVKSSTIATYAALASFADSSGFCFPSVAAIAERAGLSLAIARRECVRLKSLGYLRVEPHHIGARQTSNRYLLTWQSAEGIKSESEYQKEEGGTSEITALPTTKSDGRTKIIINDNQQTIAEQLVEKAWSATGKAQRREAVVKVVKTARENGCSDEALLTALKILNTENAYISAYSLQSNLKGKPLFKGGLLADQEKDWSKESSDL
jgi:hypothetical protein